MLTGNMRTPINPAPSIDAAKHGGGGSANGAVIDDQALLAALRAGHEWAFETMVRLYGGRLLAVARRFTRNDEDAQDVVQSAYLSAFRAFKLQNANRGDAGNHCRSRLRGGVCRAGV